KAEGAATMDADRIILRTRPGHRSANSGNEPPRSVNMYGRRMQRRTKQIVSAQKKAGPLNTSTSATAKRRRYRQAAEIMSIIRSGRFQAEEVRITGQPRCSRRSASSSEILRLAPRLDRKLPTKSTPGFTHTPKVQSRGRRDGLALPRGIPLITAHPVVLIHGRRSLCGGLLLPSASASHWIRQVTPSFPPLHLHRSYTESPCGRLESAMLRF